MNDWYALSDMYGARTLSGSSSTFYTTIVFNSASWINDPTYHVGSSNNALCPQFNDSTIHDLFTILNSVGGDSIDTIFPILQSFDFISGGTFFDLNYMFASDQYDSLIQAHCAEYPNQSEIIDNLNWADRICGPNNDGAAIFLSGPGINGPYSRNAENIAVLPNGAGPICVRNIHPTLPINSACGAAVNAQYYVSNNDTDFVFNGHTTELSVHKIQINPCDTYKIFLVLGEAGIDTIGMGSLRREDEWGASALIVKKHSAKTGFWQPAPLQLYDGYGKDTLVEGCPGVMMRFVRFFQLGQPDSIHLMYEGSATWGQDYDSLPEWVYFQPGQDTLEFLITPTPDSNVEGIENLVIKLMPPGVYECPVDTTEVELWIADRPPFNAVMADTFFFDPCETDSIAIGPDTIEGLAPVTYLWSTGQTTPVINVAPLSNQGYSLTVYDACQFDSIVLTTVTRTAPAPEISLINHDSTIHCNQGLLPIGFEVLANYYPQFEYKWASGETDSIISVNTLENGTYIYGFKILRPCMPDSFEYSITVHVENAPFSAQLTDIEAKHCPGWEYELEPTVAGGYLPYSFAWNNGATTQNTLVSPDVTDTFTLSMTDACGLDTVVEKVVVNVPDYDSLKILGETRINLPCPIGYVNIRSEDYRGEGGMAGTQQKHYSFSWNNWQSTGKELQFFTDKDTLLTLRMRDTCDVDEAVLQLPVTVFKGPFLAASFPDSTHVCLGDPIILQPEVKDGVTPYTYEWSNGSTNATRAFVPETAIETYKVTVSDFCDFRRSASTVVSATRPTADYIAHNDTYDPLLVSFDNQSKGAITYQWYFGEESTSTDENPSLRLETLSQTQVKLVVEDRYGCQDSIAGLLDIPLNLFIPNAFTPNGDFLNETWIPLGYGFETLEYTIFDRWGNEVYQCNRPECFEWDGSSNGTLLPTDTYSYHLIVKPLNQREQQVRGQVTLVR
jgi:gliding motility-associated-like protein